MEIQLNSKLFFIGLFCMISHVLHAQKLTNIVAESDGQRITVSYDLEDLPRGFAAKVDLRFDLSTGESLSPSFLSGEKTLYASGQNYKFVWDAAREKPGLSGTIEPNLSLTIIKFQYMDVLQKEGKLDNKSFAVAFKKNLLLPGAGLNYTSSGQKGMSKSIVFGGLAVSALATHFITRKFYGDFRNATDPLVARSSYDKAMGLQPLAWGFGVTATTVYLLDQFSMINKRKYFRK